MDIQLDDLVPLARVEEREAALADRIRSAERRLELARKAVDGPKQRLATLDVRLAALRKEEHTVQDEIRKAESLRQSARNALELGLGDSKAVEHQLATCAGTIDRAETRVLEILEERDALVPERAEVEAALAEAVATQVATDTKETPAIAALRSELEAAGAERAALRAVLPRDVGNTYDTVRARRGSGLARVVDKTCTACARGVPSQRLVDVRAGRLVQCDGCTRWLWIDTAA